MDTDTRLLDLCDNLYFPLRLSIRSEKTRYQYRRALRDFGDFQGRPATIADLHDDLLTMWLSKLLDSGLAVDTIRERIGRVQTLWAWLARRGVVTKWPTVIKPPSPDPLPFALTQEQLRSIFHSASKERGRVAGIPADLWWPSFLGFVWCTTERKGAALSVRVVWLDLDRKVCTIPPDARKGKRKWGVYPLWDELIPLLRGVVAIDPARELVWPWEKNEASYYTTYDRILRDAGIPLSRKVKTHGLRVSHATHLQIAGGDPQRKLMHGDRATTDRHYIDLRMLPPEENKLFIPWEPRP